MEYEYIAAHTDMLDDAAFTRFLLRIISEKLPELTFEEIKAMIGPTLVKFEDTQFYKDLQAR